MSHQEQFNIEKMVFRKTNTRQGRHISITPENGTMRHLNYARIILSPSTPTASFSNGGHETGLVCLSGNAEVKAGGETFHLGKYDAIYIPRETQIEVKAVIHVDIAEFSAGVEQRHPLRFIAHQQVLKDPSLQFFAGGATNKRDLTILIGNNISAGRLLAGFTFSEPGN